ncbi:hypothetical protein KBY83_04300 [Cyanobium sp. WKJ7-Wakatipu]|uniref:hypothetical protein n=1 Tax=Cyanobium sp. WKJ7-Wakatipu TaxID=2823726 RepID=UPI0020CF64CB|nr:hypothetical protein [Cyanobium sp. WKJ7-Wakatipu]MCP9782541.1 hypothetical protein [Cyanobium sp. WKJ7-Wakatipu]
MGLLLAGSLVEPVARGLLGSISCSGGPTVEQRRLLQALLNHLWERPDLRVSALEPIAPEELAAALDDLPTRRVAHLLQMTLEFCRHPQTDAQLALGWAYAEALGVDQAAADVGRIFTTFLPLRSEPGLADPLASADQPEPELVARIEGFAQLPEASLGRALLGYYERFGFPLPGRDACALNHLYLAHDMTHVIAGIAATSAGEIALSAFQWAMQDNPINESALLASLVTHEAGFVSANPTLAPDHSSLDSPSAAYLLASELKRGSACSADFSLVDHLVLAPLPLTEVRQQFNVCRPHRLSSVDHLFWEAEASAAAP